MKEIVCDAKHDHRRKGIERETESEGEHGEEAAAEANLAPPSNFFTLTTIHNTQKNTRPLPERGEEQKLI